MQIFHLLGYACNDSETLLPGILGEQPLVKVNSFSGTTIVIETPESIEPLSAEEMVKVVKEKLLQRDNNRVIFLDVFEQTNPDNSSIFFDNTFKNLIHTYYMNNGNENTIKGSIADIIKEKTAEVGIDPYYIAEEEDGTILSITRKT